MLHSRPRVLLADDYAGILTALRRLLEPSCEVVGLVSDGTTLVNETTRLHPDVVVLDVTMPAINGLEACRQIKASMPNTTVVFLTAADDAAVRERAFSLGASAFVLKYAATEHLLPAIELAFRDQIKREMQ